MLQHLIAHMSDTLGGGEIPTGLDAVGILNQAGEHLHSMHAWRWAQGRSTLLSLRGTVTGTAATWAPGTLKLTLSGAFTNYSFLDGDEIQITGGTGVTAGFYRVASRTDANNIILSTSIGSASTDVAFTLQPYSIDLPDDLREIIAIVSTGTPGRRITLTTLTEVLSSRRSGFANDAHWYGAISYVGQPQTPILEIAPGSGSTVAGALRMFYRGRWARLTTDSIAVAVPEFCENLLLMIARAFARGYVREDQGSLDARLAEIQVGPIFMAAKRSDGAVQPSMGKMRGGGPTIWRRHRSGDFFETTGTFLDPA